MLTFRNTENQHVLESVHSGDIGNNFFPNGSATTYWYGKSEVVKIGTSPNDFKIPENSYLDHAPHPVLARDA